METENSSGKSPFEKAHSVFPAKVIKAASTGGIYNSEPFVRQLNRDLVIFRGLSSVLQIVHNNAVIAENHDPEDVNSVPPLSGFTEGTLVEFATEICNAMVSEIHRVADWAEKHGIKNGGA